METEMGVTAYRSVWHGCDAVLPGADLLQRRRQDLLIQRTFLKLSGTSGLPSGRRENPLEPFCSALQTASGRMNANSGAGQGLRRASASPDAGKRNDMGQRRHTVTGIARADAAGGTKARSGTGWNKV